MLPPPPLPPPTRSPYIIGESRKVFKSLTGVWRHTRLSTGKKLASYAACAMAKLLYNPLRYGQQKLS